MLREEQEALIGTEVDDQHEEDLKNSLQGVTGCPEGLTKVRFFESQVKEAETSTQLMEILIAQHRQEKLETSVNTMKLIHEIRLELTREIARQKETQEQMEELERLLGEKRLAAYELIRRRINQYRLTKALKNLMAG